MAFPASQPLPYEALSTARRTLAGLRATVSDLRTESVSADIPRTRVVGLMGLLAGAIDRLTAAAAVSGIGQYAKDQYADQNLDVVADFQSAVAAATSLRDWIYNNFPTDAGSGAWLATSYDNAGTETVLLFTSAQLSGFRTQADAFLATVS